VLLMAATEPREEREARLKTFLCVVPVGGNGVNNVRVGRRLKEAPSQVRTVRQSQLEWTAGFWCSTTDVGGSRE
jgi:hypothetical protein